MRDERREARDLLLTLRTIVQGGPPALEVTLPRLQRLLRGDRAAAFGFQATADGVTLAFAHGTSSLGAAARPTLESLLRRHPHDFGAFDPACPEPLQRNVALLRRDLTAIAGWEGLPVVRELLPAVGLQHHDLVRALVCDGPALLAWVGVFRRTPFAEADRRLFERVLPALQRRLVVERQLAAAPVAAAALTAALDAMTGPAFLLRERGHVVQANAAARAILARDPHAVAADLRAAVAGRGDPRFTVTPLASGGAPEHFLAVVRPSPATPTPRAAAAAIRWMLTARQREVLSLLVAGQANKSIAARLCCAERTVEMHVTALLGKTGCAHRAELVAKFWREL